MAPIGKGFGPIPRCFSSCRNVDCVEHTTASFGEWIFDETINSCCLCHRQSGGWLSRRWLHPYVDYFHPIRYQDRVSMLQPLRLPTCFMRKQHPSCQQLLCWWSAVFLRFNLCLTLVNNQQRKEKKIIINRKKYEENTNIFKKNVFTDLCLLVRFKTSNESHAQFCSFATVLGRESFIFSLNHLECTQR